MLDFTNCNIESISVHNVGNKTNGEEIRLSRLPLDTSDIRLRELLLKFFLTPFSKQEYHSFTFSNGDFSLNPIYKYSSDIFLDNNSLHSKSIDMAKYLFDVSQNPQIKAGDLFVVYFTDVNVEDEIVDAIGIFKSEQKQHFLKLDISRNEFKLNFEDGISVDRLDKGCLIFNTDREIGFRVCLVDKSNRASESQYWKETFLNLKPYNDDYYRTKEFLNITKSFITSELPDEFNLGKAEKIDLLNRSVGYFKTHDSFNKEDFENEIFQDDTMIQSFKDFDKTYRIEKEIEILDNFEISTQAVKSQSRVFKNVLKLDKNFDIYIHGDKQLIEKGVDSDGRKYYKIYYQTEV